MTRFVPIPPSPAAVASAVGQLALPASRVVAAVAHLASPVSALPGVDYRVTARGVVVPAGLIPFEGDVVELAERILAHYANGPAVTFFDLTAPAWQWLVRARSGVRDVVFGMYELTGVRLALEDAVEDSAIVEFWQGPRAAPSVLPCGVVADATATGVVLRAAQAHPGDGQGRPASQGLAVRAQRVLDAVAADVGGVSEAVIPQPASTPAGWARFVGAVTLADIRVEVPVLVHDNGHLVGAVPARAAASAPSWLPARWRVTGCTADGRVTLLLPGSRTQVALSQ